jgi:hypothetical protein
VIPNATAGRAIHHETMPVAHGQKLHHAEPPADSARPSLASDFPNTQLHAPLTIGSERTESREPARSQTLSELTPMSTARGSTPPAPAVAPSPREISTHPVEPTPVPTLAAGESQEAVSTAPAESEASTRPPPGVQRTEAPKPASPNVEAMRTAWGVTGKNPPAPHGTPGAQQPPQMKMAQDMNETADATEQNLPARPLLAGDEVRFQAQSESVVADPVEAPFIAPASVASTVAAEGVTPASPAQARAVERAEALIALHAMRLHESGSDTLRVVIKPGPDLHLSLNLNMRDGSVEVQAQLHRGDFELMNRHWPQLQEQMEQRGVRLAPLAQSDSEQGAPHFSQHSRRDRHDEENGRTGAFAEFVIPGTLVPKPAQLGRPRNGWESWA